MKSLLKEIEGYKTEGGKYINSKNYESAIREYERANELALPQIKDSEFRKLYIQCTNNISISNFNLKRYKLVIENCNKVLDLEPNAKAFYRRALAFKEIGEDMEKNSQDYKLEELQQNYRRSKEDFEQLNKLEVSKDSQQKYKELQQNIERVKIMIKERNRQKEKASRDLSIDLPPTSLQLEQNLWTLKSKPNFRFKYVLKLEAEYLERVNPQARCLSMILECIGSRTIIQSPDEKKHVFALLCCLPKIAAFEAAWKGVPQQCKAKILLILADFELKVPGYDS